MNVFINPRVLTGKWVPQPRLVSSYALLATNYFSAIPVRSLWKFRPASVPQLSASDRGHKNS